MILTYIKIQQFQDDDSDELFFDKEKLSISVLDELLNPTELSDIVFVTQLSALLPGRYNFHELLAQAGRPTVCAFLNALPRVYDPELMREN